MDECSNTRKKYKEMEEIESEHFRDFANDVIDLQGEFFQRSKQFLHFSLSGLVFYF